MLRPVHLLQTRLLQTGVLLAGVLLAGLLLCACPQPGHAQEDGQPDIPGLSRDSNAFLTLLTRPYPAGGTDAGRQQSETRAAAAALRNDWTGVSAALEDRLGQGKPSYDLWRQLAQAETKRTPPDLARGLFAAWQAFQIADDADKQAAALVLAAQALTAQNRPAQAGAALRAAVFYAPGNDTYRQMLADANRAAGLLVQRVTTSPDADPPRACIIFNVPPRRADFQPGDWVTLTPPAAQAAVTREGDQVCISGLPLGAVTTAQLREGLPGEGGISLKAAANVRLAMGNRSPLLAFDNRLFILPHGQAPRVTLTSSNIRAVKLSIALFTERTLLPWARANTLGQAMGSDLASNLDKDSARVVWTGSAEIAGFTANALMHTVLPLPAEAMRLPGLYVVSVLPGDGQTGDTDGVGAVQPVLQTDLAPTVWRGADGLTVQVRGYSDARPRAGVHLRLMAQNNDILAETDTDASGIARFAAPLLHGEGVMAPAALQGMGEPPAGTDAPVDFVSLALDATAFDLSDRGVSGAPQPGPLDAWLWTERGIYRPGETLNLMALLRDGGGQPVQRPAHLRVLRPNGQVFRDAVVQPGGGGSLHLPVTLSNGAAAGIWTAQVLADPKQPPIGEIHFKVDAFVPDRMAVTIGKPPAQLGLDPAPLPISADFLYGAPAAHLSGSATLRLGTGPAPAALDGFQVGLVDEVFAPKAVQIALPPTDDAGHTTLPLRLAALPDTSRPVQAAIDVEIDDPSGHAAHATTTIPMRPATSLIGIRTLFDGSVNAGSEAGFDIAAVDPDGQRVAMPVQLRLVRERPEWRLVRNGSISSYETVWRDSPLETHALTVPAGGVLHFARILDFGRYRLEVAQQGGLAAASVRFRSGWVSADSPDVPDRADVSADLRAYAPGATAHIHVAAPFGGPASLLVMSDRVHAISSIDVPEAGGDYDVTVDPAWGPGAYVAVHVFRPGSQASGAQAQRPDRAIGIVWLGVDPAARHLDVSFDAPPVVRPQAVTHATLHTTPGAWVAVSAVDEGILRLTNFTTPDPAPHFLGRRTLGVDIRDDYGRLIAPADGAATLLRQGGDEDAGRRPNIPQQIVSLFLPPVQADAEGRVDVALPFPDFAGQVRIMAVAWDGNRLGSAATDIIVRDKLVAQALLPRFLAPGDTGRLAVLLQNVDLPDGPVTLRVTTDGPLAIDGDPGFTTTLAHGAQAVPAMMLRGTGAGTGHVHLAVTGPGGFAAQHDAALDVHPVRLPDSIISAQELAAGMSSALAPPFASYIGGTWRASAVFGSPVRFDAGALVRALDAYPLFCLEQATSKGLPLALLPDGAIAGPDRLARLQRSVNDVLDRQRYDGAFGLWSATGEAEPWLSVYATEFLIRAGRAGASVGEAGLKDALAYQAGQVNTVPPSPEAYAGQAYRLYVLALAGQGRAGASRVLFENLGKLPTPLAKAQLGAALALGNDAPRAERAFAAALDSPARNRWGADYGSAVRDQAAVAVLLKESGLLPERLAVLLGQMPGADTRPDALNTQEQAWLAAAAGALGRTGGVTRITLDGRALPPGPVVTAVLDGAATARNTGDRAVWQTVSITGVPVQPRGAARSGMRVTRRFLNPDGTTLDLQHLRQNTVFLLVLEGTAEDGQDHRVQLLQGLPAGWEIAGRLAAGDVPGMPWLGTLTATEAEPAADDRYQAVIGLTADQPAFRVAVRLRAVTPGNYEIPGADLSDMYRPGLFARQGLNRIDVLPPQ